MIGFLFAFTPQVTLNRGSRKFTLRASGLQYVKGPTLVHRVYKI